MTGTSQGGKKAALTRGYNSLSEAGRKGGLNSRQNVHNKNSVISNFKSTPSTVSRNVIAAKKITDSDH